MASFDLVIRNGTLVDHERIHPRSSIGVSSGRIAAVAVGGDELEGREVIDASGLHVLPGVIDAHVHFREPGLTHKETFAAGSAAAARGGVTCVLDMPNTEPPTDTAERFAGKAALVAGTSWVDYGLFGLIGPGSLAGLAGVVEAGAMGLKCFMGQSERPPGSPLPPDDGELFLAMRHAARQGVRVALHAENHGVMQALIAELRAAGRRDLAAHNESRPPFVEVEAIQRAALFAEATGAAIHILHLSSAAGVEEVRRWKARGVDITAEVTPQHALLDVGRLGDRPDLRVNPPIRAESDARALLAGLADGTVDLVASDHAPHAVEERSGEDVWASRAGLPGVGTLLQVMLDEALTGDTLTLSDVVRVTSTAPARVWGLHPRKGRIASGADADLTLVDTGGQWRVPAEPVGGSPFAGRSGTGRAVATLVRGQKVAADGACIGEPAGRLVRRSR